MLYSSIRRMFPHISLPPLQALNSMQRNSTHKEQENILSPKHKIQEKLLNQGFPFSVHDNRYILQNTGEYLNSGLGRRKVSMEKRQHNSQNFYHWDHESSSQGSSKHDCLTLYQTQYMGNQNINQPFCRRYPKNYMEKSCSAQVKMKKDLLWFRKDTIPSRTPQHVLMSTQYHFSR
nr:PREDICTED: testis-expressed sequence 36 protein isoform X2 [Latimeria chalumnae]|eukprot:XP_014343025.1 PREDICTED: testis-expressed sequence 36 protein isoform X2 [Latimeria chalumnae]